VKGWLTKQGGFVKNFKRRYFVWPSVQSPLQYFTDSEVRGVNPYC
jgi:hypothetical protein